MKLYTEEQVRQIFKETQHLQDCNEPLYHMFEDLLVDNNITPIELPSDDEMGKILEPHSDEYAAGYYGAINMIEEKILNQFVDVNKMAKRTNT